MHYSLAEHGRVYSTRERGAELRDHLLAATSGDDEISIDFENVLSATHSFLDEFFGKLAERRQVQPINASVPIQTTLRKVLKRRGVTTASASSFAAA